jgi:hypothetical protein
VSIKTGPAPAGAGLLLRLFGGDVESIPDEKEKA